MGGSLIAGMAPAVLQAQSGNPESAAKSASEIRDFYTGNPNLKARLAASGQHNVVAGGGFVLRFGHK